MTTDQNTLSDGVPNELWRVPEQFIPSEELQFLHSDICARLREDNPDADTLELLAIERIASLYFWMRHKEASDGFKSDQSYKGMIDLWTKMAADLRKARTEHKTATEAQKEIMGMLVGAINDALAGIDPEIANTVKRRIQHAMSDMG
jgi:hypothetical protein